MGTMNFIDIASHQAGMNLETMFKSNPKLDGVIIKAGSGTAYTNPYFKEWADWLYQNGKPLGAYHYCRELTANPSTPEAEARHFYSIVKPYVGKIVVAADFEREKSDALQQGTGWLKRFLDAFYQLSGVRPLVYCSQSVTQSYNFSEIANAGYKLWMAQYADMNPVYGFQTNPWHNGSVSPFNGYVMHQYTSQGYLNGWGNNLDFDQFSGSYSSWCELAGGGETPPEPVTPKEADPEVVLDVLHGLYGIGQERIDKLTAAGYSATSVQSKVNEMYGIALSCRKYIKGNTDYLESLAYLLENL